MDKVLTIVIPSYNVAKFLPEVLPTYTDERILEDIEILIVNDGSKDDTGEIADEFASRYPYTIKHIKKANGGHGSTINCGLKEATGKYFKVIDGDDWVDTEELVALVNDLANIDSDVVLTPYMRVYESGDSSKKSEIDVADGSVDKASFKKELETFKSVFDDATKSGNKDALLYGKEYQISDVLNQVNDVYQIHSTTFKTEVVKQIPAISENCFYVDVEYVIFPLEFAKTVTFLKHPVYQYRLGNANQSVSAKNLIKNRAMHEKVTRRIIEFSKKQNFTGNMKEFIDSRLRGLARNQMDIFLSLPDTKEGKALWKEFSSDLKREVPHIYKTLAGKKAKVLRVTNDMAFGMMSRVTKKKLGL